jgi:hypothetical protein
MNFFVNAIIVTFRLQVDFKYQNTMKALRAVIVPGNGSGDVANANWYVA